MSVTKEIKRVTTNSLQEMKKRGERIAMLTAYDYSMAAIVDEAGMDIILVGDSASNVMAGHETTLPITLDQMIYHAQSVVRAAKGRWLSSTCHLVPTRETQKRRSIQLSAS